MKKNTFMEFFAGGGMARAGLGTEWECVFANDISATKAESYVANWGDADLAIGDVFDLTMRQLPTITTDLAWGSFPCQDLSLAGNGAGLNGERSTAFWGFWNLLKGLIANDRKPRMIVLENVVGTLTSRGGEDFAAIIKAVVAGGYRVGAMVVDAVHFVPQSRPRVFFVAIDNSLAVPDTLCTDGPLPSWHNASLIRGFHQLPSRLKDQWLWWNLPSKAGPTATLDDLVEADPSGVAWHTAAETKALLMMMTPLNRKKVIEAQAAGKLKVGTIYRRTRLGEQRAEVRFDGISGCLRTPSGGSSRQTIIIVRGSEIRTRLISPRETARLMGLPDTYELPARYNDAYHLCGDGVVVPVVEHIAKSILNPMMKANRHTALRSVA